MYNQQAVYIEILRSQSDVSHVSILFQLYDLPERSIDNGNGTTLKSNLICLSVVYNLCDKSPDLFRTLINFQSG